jgi:hypothetical protein
MASQPSYRPLEPATFFSDGMSSRHLVAGTVARGHLKVDAALETGRVPGTNERQTVAVETQAAKNATAEPALPEEIKRNEAARVEFVDTFPFPVTRDVVEHGYNRFMIYCVVCHDPLGTGRGKIVERGYTAPPSYHIPRLREAPVGRLFAVISEGYGSMPSYAGQIPVRDRWAIVAYVRALQLSQHFPTDQLTPEMRQEMSASQAPKEKP